MTFYLRQFSFTRYSKIIQINQTGKKEKIKLILLYKRFIPVFPIKHEKENAKKYQSVVKCRLNMSITIFFS